MTYNGNFYDNIKIEVIGYNPCAEVYPSSSDGTHIGIGAVALMANAAPTGFGYKWYSTNRTTQVGTSKNFTTPRLTTTTTYYLAYVHNVSGCITEKIPIKAKILDHNFVKKFTARKAGLTESIIQNASPSDSYKETTYYDGLGRPMQNVKRQASVNGKDLITPIAYDPFGRKAKEYLPYFETTGIQDGSFRSNALATQTDRSIAIYGDVFAYSEKAFEPSPLNRLEKQTAPGEAWKMGSGHEIKFARRTNDNNPEGINDQVRLFRVNAEGLPFSEGIYSPGELWVEISDDEDDNRTLTYTDKQGKIILKKQQETADKESQGPVGWLSTYYVYDYFDKLRVVIPPQASKILSEIGWDQSVNSDLANAQYFLYRYDARKRLIKKKVPAKQASHMVYDQQDRLVGFQDGNLAAKPSMNWLFTKYDGLGRIIRTGFTTDKRNREELQAYLDTQSGNNARTTANTAHTRSESDISSVKYDGYKVYLPAKVSDCEQDSG
ncbi:Cell well associated RhsD protein [Cyclobacterium qasimii M12-11B]|uniref:Cell well associated RhsD protein n=2 Tax=Cyclobacterium qasimii TaxID=1350429 RepID=S7WQE6_9BACT|nr:Cell well associated RhsD protein [Cyclobacterium qasimii M12-11B]